MRCVDLNIMLGQLDPADSASANEHWVSREYIDNAFRAYPQIVRNTEALLYHCEAELPCGNINNRQTFTGSSAMITNSSSNSPAKAVAADMVSPISKPTRGWKANSKSSGNSVFHLTS